MLHVAAAASNVALAQEAGSVPLVVAVLEYLRFDFAFVVFVACVSQVASYCL